MVMTATAVFAQNPKTANALVTLAVASLTTATPTNIVPVFTAGANGAIVTRIAAAPRGSITATALYLFKSTDAGATQHLKDSATIPTQTITTGAGISKTYFSDYSETRPLRLGAGDILYAGLGATQASGISVDIEYTNF